MHRRNFLIAGALIALSVPANAQPQGKVPRVGVLRWDAISSAGRLQPFREALHQNGLVEGKNLQIEWRFADGRTDRAREIAEEFVRAGVDVIVAFSTPAGHAAKDATRSIPIIVATADPLATGLVTGLARPGGNVTGVSLMMPDLAAKRVELLTELLPGLARLGFLGSTRDPAAKSFVRHTADAAERKGIQLHVELVPGPEDFAQAFEKFARGQVQAVVVQPLFTLDPPVAARVVEIANRHRIPVISDYAAFAREGALVAYGPRQEDTLRLTARYLKQVLNGASPGDLPVTQPTNFVLAVNMKVASALGVQIPPAIVLRADELVE
jgi:putative tryptophan/tyrosine transport system substrate-binding protein